MTFEMFLFFLFFFINNHMKYKEQNKHQRGKKKNWQ